MSDTRRPDVLVVGGGQAGLAAGYYLARAGIPFLIVEAAARIGESWRRRWDSLQLFTAARYSALPGMPFPGDPEHFPGKDEVADYLGAYAEHFELPVCLNARADSLALVDGRYLLETTSGRYEAPQVIVSTGAYQRPHVPAIADHLDGAVLQLHSRDYRNPAQIAAREVLVVGSANSGAQIAEDLSSAHRVHLARGKRLRRFPRRILGNSLHWWAERLDLIQAPLDSLRGRTQMGDLLIGTSLRQLAHRHGVELLPRAVSAEGRTIRFADGRSLDVETVIWATGFRADYSWIEVPVFDERGSPRHRRGVTDSPGLYFLGMHLQYSRGSSLVGWVRHDAEFIVDQVRSGVGLRTARSVTL